MKSRQPASTKPKTHQFSIANLLLLATLFAVAWGVAAPLIRLLPPQRQGSAIFNMSALLVVFLLSCGAAFLIRVRVQHLAGGVIYAAGGRHSHMLSLTSVILPAIVIGCYLTVWFNSQSQSGPTDGVGLDTEKGNGLLFHPMVLISIYVIAMHCVSVFWWRLDPTGLEVCEKGLVIGVKKFIPYDSISHYRWNKFDPSKLMLQLGHTQRPVPLRMSDKPGVDQALASHVPMKAELV